MQAKVTSPTALALVAGLLGAACSAGPPPAPHGAPVLKAVYWIAGGAPLLAWTPADAPSSFLVSPVPPFATQVDFVFDRRLDGDLIEDTVIVDGIPTTQPKAMPPVEVQWPGGQRETFGGGAANRIVVLEQGRGAPGGSGAVRK